MGDLYTCKSINAPTSALWKELDMNLSHSISFDCWELTQEKGKHTSTCMFTAVLFTKAKRWKQPQCPLTGEWINNGILVGNKKGIKHRYRL